MRQQLRLTTIELRYAPTLYLFQHGPTTVAGLIDALDYQGFEIPGRASKSVYRIHTRVPALREQAAALNARDNDAFWDALPA